MQRLAERRQTVTVRCVLYGAILGCSVPVIAIWLDLVMQGLPVTAANIFQVRAHHLHWIIDAASVLLGCLTGLVGVWHGRLLQLNAELSTTNAELRAEVTARKWAEEELVRLSSAVRTSTDSIVLTDLEGRITEINEATLELHGVDDKGDLIGKSAFAFIAPEDQKRAFAGMKEVLEKGYVKGREYSVIHKNGSKIPVEMSVSIIKNAAGNPIGFAGISRDIAARRRAEENIRIYAEIVRNMQIGLYVYHLEDLNDDSTLRMVATNPAAVQLTGVAMESVVGKTLDENFPGLRAQGIPQTYAEVVRSGQAVELETVSYGDDRVLQGAFSAKAFPLPNQCMGVVFENITARKQAEEALRKSERFNALLIAQSPLGIITYTPDGSVTSVNHAWEKIWGVTWKQLKGYNLWTDPQLFSTPLREALEHLVQQGGAIPPSELEYDIGTTLPSGNRRWASCKFYTVQEENGEVTKLVCLNEDITVRKQMEEALRESEARLRPVVTSAPLALFAVDRGGVFTLREGKGLEVLGLKSEEVLGRSVFDVYRDVPQIGDNIRRALAGEEFTATVKVGRLTFETRHCPLRDQHGVVTGVIGVAIDITERQRAEEALRENEARYRQLFENANDAIFIVDPQGRILAVNHQVVELTGVPKEEILGKTTEIFLPGKFAQSLERIKQVMREGKLGPYELEFTTPLGKKLFSLNAFTYCEGGTPVGVINIGRDITERKRMEEALRQAEEQYRSIFENAAEGIFQTSPTGAILVANPTLARMLGYDSPDDLRGQVTNVATQVYVDPNRRAELLEMLKEHDIVRGVEVECYRRDGSKFWASLSIQAVQDATGAILCYEGSIEDITKRRAVDQLKDEFVSLVSHELRTPLTAIRGSLGLLASGMLGPVPDKGQRMLDIAVRNTDRLVRLINDILDVERIQSGKVDMVKTTCNIADLMIHAGEVMQAMAEKAGVTLVVEPVQAQLWADSDRIIQTLTNLLSNAIKFSLAGTTVWLTAEQRGEQLLVQVKDQGRGIPADKLESIFERFQQVDASDSREKGGTGLGLAICRSIVQQHGGRIWAESELGEGSLFSLTLLQSQEERPATPASSVSSPMNPDSEKDRAIVARNGQRQRLQVLVAEDDRDLARVLIAMFERHGAIVYYAQTGAEAIQCCDFVVPDLLVLDPIMPEHDGFVVVDWMRQRERLCQIPVVVYAAGELTATERQQLTLGPTQFFTKSRIPPEQFEQQVLQWLSQIFPAGEEGHS